VGVRLDAGGCDVADLAFLGGVHVPQQIPCAQSVLGTISLDGPHSLLPARKVAPLDVLGPVGCLGVLPNRWILSGMGTQAVLDKPTYMLRETGRDARPRLQRKCVHS